MRSVKKTAIYIIGIAAAFLLPAKAQSQETAGAVSVNKLNISATDDSVTVSMELDFSSLELPSNRAIYLNPVLKADSGTYTLPSVAIMGRRQYFQHLRNSNDGRLTALRREDGQAQRYLYKYTLGVDSKPDWVSIRLDQDSCGCNQKLLADRSIMQASRDFSEYIPRLAYISPQAEVRKTRHETGTAYIDFPVNVTEIRPDYRDNRQELDRIAASLDTIIHDSDIIITGIALTGHASPEGPYSRNVTLAEDRTLALLDYIQHHYRLERSIFSYEFIAEDWEGLRKFIAGSGMEDRNALLAIIDDGSLEPDAKENKIRSDYPAAFRYLVDSCLPSLRHTDYIVEYTVRGFDVEEARRIIWERPQKLSLQEMYAVAQTYEEGSAPYNEVFEIAVRLFPDDPVANLNAANSALLRGDTAAAARYLARTSDCGESMLARGVLAIMNGNYDEAERMLTRASGMNIPNAEYNLSELRRIKQNKY